MAKNLFQWSKKQQTAPAGQTLVEFALIIGFVLVFAFIIIESGRMFQAWQTVQNAARSAGRYAITGQYDRDCVGVEPRCSEPYDPRVYSIQQVALSAATGLVIDPGATFQQPYYFGTEVIGVDESGIPRPAYAGASNQPVYIRVTYRLALITPFLSSVTPSIRLHSSVIVNNEDFDQFGSTVTNPSGPPANFVPGPPQEQFIDLWLIKESVPASAVVDTEYEYHLTIHNIGDTHATNVQLVDNLPAGVAFVSATAGYGCSHAGGVVTCTDLGIIPPNPWDSPDPALRREITIRVRAPQTIATSPTTIVNTATVSAAEPEVVTGNNSDTAATQIISLGSDVEVSEIVSIPDPVTAGQNFTLRVTARNNGPDLDPATNVFLSMTLDPDLTYLSGNTSKGTACSYDNGTRIINCLLNTLNRNESAEAFIELGTTDPGSYAHVATVTAAESDPLPDNNTRSATTNVVPPAADLYVTKSSSPAIVMPGQEITYLIQVVNTGPSTATDINVVDTLPAGTTFVSAGPNCGTAVAGVVTCNIASLSPNIGQNTANLTVVVMVPQGFAIGTITNQVEVSGAEHDPNMGNNTATAITQIVAADLQITKGPQGDPQVNEGQPFDFTINVTNNGPSPATGVLVTDPLHNTFQFVAATPSQGICSHSGSSPGGTVNCNIGSLAVGASAAITLRVIPTVGSSGQGTQYANTATVSGNQGDPVATNNSSTATIRVAKTNNPFITLTPSCAESGNTVRVNGYNFSTGGNRSLTITMNPGNHQLYFAANFSQEIWQQNVTLPTGLALDQDYTIQAVRHTDNPTAVLRVPCPKPDLVISNLQLGSGTPITTHTPITFTATVANIGDLAVVTQFYVSLYLNPPPPASGATHIPSTYRATGAVVGISGLQAGETRQVTLTATGGVPTLGSHQIYAVVDSDPSPTGLINERLETNNIAGPLTVVATEEGEPPPPLPPADDTGNLQGFTFTPQPGLGPVQQPFTPVYVYDSNNVLVAYQNSAANGFYRFLNLPVGFYTVAACITLDGLQYFALTPGVEILENTTTQFLIYMEQTACWPQP